MHDRNTLDDDVENDADPRISIIVIPELPKDQSGMLFRLVPQAGALVEHKAMILLSSPQ